MQRAYALWQLRALGLEGGNMAKTPEPSRYILQKAWVLGRKMAQTERRLRPDVSRSEEYPTYELFQLAHRHHLEQLNAFIPWDEKIQALVEREGRGGGYRLDDPRVWEAFYTHVASKISSAFWYGWEQVYQLQQLYEEHCREFRAKQTAPSHVLHVARPPVAQVAQGEDCGDRPDDVEDGLWNQIAAKLFDEQGRDNASAFWAMPAPESAGRKSA
jgi:hypothetical protein